MKRLLMIVVSIAFAGTSLGSSPQEAPGRVEEFSVNGLKVILKTIDANEIVSAQLYLRGGALNLAEENQGIEQFMFTSAAKGSTKYSKEKLNTLLDRTASAIDINAEKDNSSVSLRCLKQDFDDLWDAFADVVMHPTFVPQDVEVVRNNMLLEIKQRKDNPDTYLNDVAEQVFYAGHPYRFDPRGVENSIAAITIDQMKNYLAEHLVTSRLLLVVVGNVNKETVQKKVTATLGTLPRGNYMPVLPKPVVHTAPSLKVIERQIPTNYFCGCFTLPSPPDPEFYGTLVMMNILATRVWEEVRTKRNLSYAPGAWTTARLASEGAIYVSSVYPDSAVKVMLVELKRLQSEPVSAKDLRDRITMFLTGYNLQREANASQGGFLAFHELSGLGWRAAEQFVENVRNVKAEDIQNIAQKYFHNIQSVVIGDPKLVTESVYQF